MLLGITLGGRFRVALRSAENNLGIVYRAYDTEAQHSVSVRTLHSRYHADDRMVNQFRQQIETVGKLQSENTARILAVIDEPGIMGYVTELLDGVTLASLLESEGRLDRVRALLIGKQIADSLVEAHGKGIVHRDLNPENVLLGSDHRGDIVKLHGYGLTTIREHSTVSAARRGDRGPNYIAPEQVRRHQPHPRQDLYALGTMLFEMISGRLPFEDPDPMVVLRLKSVHPAPSLKEACTDADVGVVQLVNGLLTARAEERHPTSARELSAQLTEHLVRVGYKPPTQVTGAELPAVDVAAETSSPAPAPAKKKRKKRRALTPVAWGALVGIMIGVGVAAVELTDNGSETPPREADSASVTPPATPETVAETTTPQPAAAAKVNPQELPKQPASAREPRVQPPAPAPQPEAAAKPAEPAAKPAEPAAKPAEPAAKPAEPAAKPEEPVVAAAKPAPQPPQVAVAAAAKPAPAEAPAAKPAPEPAPAPVADPSLPSNRTPVLKLGHRGVVRTIGYSADGTMVLTGADDRVLHVTDARTGRRLQTLTGLEASPTAAAMSPDGRYVVAGDGAGFLRVWENGKLQDATRQLPGGVHTVGFDERGTLLGADRTRRLHRLHAGTFARARPLLRLGRGGPAYSAALSGDGATIVVVNQGTGRRIVPRDTRTGKVAIQLDALPNVVAVSVDQRGEWVVAASASGRIQVIKLGADTVVHEVDHGKPLAQIALHPTAGVFASGATDGSITLWDLKTAKRKPFSGSLGQQVNITGLAFSPKGPALSAAATNFQVHTFDVDKGTVTDVLLGTPNGGAPLLSFNGAGTKLALAGPDGRVHLWDLATGEQVTGIKGLPGVSALTYEKGTERLIVATTDGHLSLYDGTKQIWRVNAKDAFGSLTTNGKQVVAASAVLGQAKRFDMKTGEELLPPVGRGKDGLRTVKFSPDGTLLAVGNRIGAAALYNLAGDEPKRHSGLLMGRGRVLDFAWRADGKLLAASFARGGLLAYDLSQGGRRPQALQRSGMTPIHTLSIEGELVSGGAADGSIRRWGLNGQTPLPAADGLPASPRWATSQDGRLVAAADEDGRVRVLQNNPGAAAALNLFSVGDAWIAWTTAAYYAGNVEGARFLRVQVGDATKQVSEYPALKSLAEVKRALAGL